MATIEPLSSRPSQISVTEAMEPAYERVKLMLFKPFDLNKWILIGFCAWLAGLGEAGGRGGSFSGFNGTHSQANVSHEPAADQLRQSYHQASDYVLANLVWLIPVAVLVIFAVLALWLLCLWLNSRGKFMLLHCVAENKAEVTEPWHAFARPANSLFQFQLIFGLAAMILLLPLLVFLAVIIVRMVLQGQPDLPGVMLALAISFGFLLLVIVFGLIRKLTMDFVVPIQFLRQGTCVAAWRELWKLLTSNSGQFALYILFQIVLSLAIGVLVITVILVTCCIAGCLLALPFIGTVLSLPVLLFQRTYSLYYLAQYGPEYNVFPQAPTAPAPPPSSTELPPLVPVS